MTYREIINSVLRRLREDTIDSDWSGALYDSVSVSDYQKLIGELVNVVKAGSTLTIGLFTCARAFAPTTALPVDVPFWNSEP